MFSDISTVLQLISTSQKIVLTTHRNSDGDGIGSLVGLYWALQNLNKLVHFCAVDEIPKRYFYMLDSVNTLNTQQVADIDLLIILDTNQGELCNPLYQFCLEKKVKILFIDHHIHQQSLNSVSDLIYQHIVLEAASTGEIVFDLIKSLKVSLNDQIANALYSSLTFDTQAFKLVKNSSRSHSIAAELAEYKINTEKIQRALFAHWTPQKMLFLSELIQNAEYNTSQSVVGLKVSLEQLAKYDLQGDDVNDLIDMFTLIPTVKFAYIIRQVQTHEFKISFRSALSNLAFIVAQNLGGGGHSNSAGVWLSGKNILEVQEQVLKQVHQLAIS